MKPSQRPLIQPRRRARGVTLIEALVALMVMSFGMVALVSLMVNLRHGGDVAKQRSEAMRLAQQELAALRAFPYVDKPDDAPAGTIDYDDGLKAAAARTPSLSDTNATFSVLREVQPFIKDADDPQARTVSVTVSWKDRADTEERLKLHTVVSRTDPVFSGALGIAPPVNGVRTPSGRNPAIPATAKDLGDGRSAFRPPGGGTAVWVFDNASGTITGKCEIDINTPVSSLTPESVETCRNNTVGYLLSGTIRFSSTNPADPKAPEAAARPLSLTVSLSASEFKKQRGNTWELLPGREYPAGLTPTCFSDAPSSAGSGQPFVNYHCIIYPNAQSPRNWWGQVLLSGLDLGTRPSQFQVCRYSADYNGNGYTYVLISAAEGKFKIDNEEHPEVYRGVSRSLARQNFLVVRGDVGCPTAPPADPANGIFVDYSTVRLQ
ncbi:MAG: prepilin-type N-terminal cleavage/methylation domain-containing protein [Roseateles sp.]|uniref:type IV pilus modification PilV family protein n=1 Tax=Roseateles sp. TaxID=1971397 RepID=UPI0039EA07BC